MLWSSYCPSRTSNVFENDVPSVKFVSGQFCIQSGWHQTEVVKLSWISHFFFIHGKHRNYSYFASFNKKLLVWIWWYFYATINVLQYLYRKWLDLYFNVSYLRPWYVFYDLFILKCCAHHEVKIAKGEVKQKSFITNEESFEGFLECNYSLQFFDNIMIVM